MPKLVVYGQEKEERVTRLRLLNEDTRIVLVAVDQHGRRLACGNLLVFNADGSITRPMSVDCTLGFKLNDAGQLEFHS